MRLIDADHLKERARHWWDCTPQSTSDFIDFVDGEPTAQQMIPVTEKLPDKDGDYLVCFEDGYREDYSFPPIGIVPYEESCEGFGYWHERYHPISLGYLDSEWEEVKVTAWMPLPESYKEEQ